MSLEVAIVLASAAFLTSVVGLSLRFTAKLLLPPPWSPRSSDETRCALVDIRQATGVVHRDFKPDNFYRTATASKCIGSCSPSEVKPNSRARNRSWKLEPFAPSGAAGPWKGFHGALMSIAVA